MKTRYDGWLCVVLWCFALGWIVSGLVYGVLNRYDMATYSMANAAVSILLADR